MMKLITYICLLLLVLCIGCSSVQVAKAKDVFDEIKEIALKDGTRDDKILHIDASGEGNSYEIELDTNDGTMIIAINSKQSGRGFAVGFFPTSNNKYKEALLYRGNVVMVVDVPKDKAIADAKELLDKFKLFKYGKKEI